MKRMTEKEIRIMMDETQFMNVRVTLHCGQVVEGENVIYESESDNDDMDEPVATVFIQTGADQGVFVTLEQIKSIEVI